jgi:hypothetical protein
MGEQAMKTRNKTEYALTEVSREELQTITGGSVDLDVPQCGNVVPVGPRPYTAGSPVQVIIPAAQNTWTGR